MSSPPVNPRIRSRFRRVAIPCLAVLLLVGLSVTAYKSRYFVFPKRFGVVVPGQIYRSGQLSRFLVESTLRKHQIRHIIDLTGFTDSDPDQRAEQEAARRLKIAHHRFNLKGDGTGEIENYAAALEIVIKAQQAGEPVLIHCAAGSQRTGGTVASYRLLFQGWSTDRVLSELESYDWNPRKDQTLLRYLDEHWAELSGCLVRRGILEKIPEKLPKLSDGSPQEAPIVTSLSD